MFRIVGQDGNPFTRVQRPVQGDGTRLVVRRDRGTRSPSPCPRPVTWCCRCRRCPAPNRWSIRASCTPTTRPQRTCGAGHQHRRPGLHQLFLTASFTFRCRPSCTSPRARAGPDHGLRDRPGPRRLHLVRRHVGPGRRPSPGNSWSPVASATTWRATTTRRRSSTSSTAAPSQHSADPAPARLGRGMEDRQPQQRRTPDACARQRLSGDADRGPGRRHDDRCAALGPGQRQRPRPGHRREREPAGSRHHHHPHQVHRVHRHVRHPPPPAQPRGQRADGAGERDPRGVQLCGRGARLARDPARVEVRDGSGDRMLAAVTPFPGFEGTPSVAMADVNGDNVLDLLVGTGPGSPRRSWRTAAPTAGGARSEPNWPASARLDAGFRAESAWPQPISTATPMPTTSSSARVLGPTAGSRCSPRRCRHSAPPQRCSPPSRPTRDRDPVSPGHRHRRRRHRTAQHRHRTGPRRTGADQDLSVRPLHPHRGGQGPGRHHRPQGGTRR